MIIIWLAIWLLGETINPTAKSPNKLVYLKLKASAETLNMSVPNFVKKKAQGSRLVAPKLDKETRQSMAKDLSKLGANVNQIAKYCNQHQHEAPNYEGLEYNINAVRERLDDIWQSLN
jgi:acyl-CoA synthetase (AMP-forming)/AMP-acid ligase II